MAKTMLAISLLVGAGACTSPAPTAQRSGLVNPPVTEPEPTSTTAATTTVPPTTTTTEPPVTTTEAPTTIPTTRARSAPTTAVYVAPAPVTSLPAAASGGDGAWVIPTYVVMCESKGRWDAENASGAAGPYQLMPEHFDGESALNQSRQAQHDKAAELWNGGVNTRSGLGPQNWEACL